MAHHPGLKALICCSAQNIYMFTYESQTNNISNSYRNKVCLAILTIIIKRFKNEEKPLNITQLSNIFTIPPRLTGVLVNFLLDCNLIQRIAPPDGADPSPTLRSPRQQAPSTTLSATSTKS